MECNSCQRSVADLATCERCMSEECNVEDLVYGQIIPYLGGMFIARFFFIPLFTLAKITFPFKLPSWLSFLQIGKYANTEDLNAE